MAIELKSEQLVGGMPHLERVAAVMAVLLEMERTSHAPAGRSAPFPSSSAGFVWKMAGRVERMGITFERSWRRAR